MQILKFSQSGRGGKRTWSQEFHITFKVGSSTQGANKLLIESFLKKGSDPRFRPSSKNVIDNSNM
jgi:hypothetical protein